MLATRVSGSIVPKRTSCQVEELSSRLTVPRLTVRDGTLSHADGQISHSQVGVKFAAVGGGQMQDFDLRHSKKAKSNSQTAIGYSGTAH